MLMTTPLWYLLTLQVVLGGFDTFYHHEFTERLAWRASQRTELILHSLRNLFYVLLFVAFAWFDPYGLWALGLFVLLLAEALLTMVDFVEEDRSRKLPATERVTHGVIAINYGAILMLLLPALWVRIDQLSTLVRVDYGWWSVAATALAVMLVVLAIRDFTAARRLDRLETATASSLVEALSERQRVLVTGATGFIGSRLVEALAMGGHEVTVLTRRPAAALALRPPFRVVTDLGQIEDEQRIDTIVNLAGEPLANGLWTKAKRNRIVMSRARITQDIVALIERLNHKPGLLLNGSAIGWYGIRDDQVLNEQDEGTECFSRQVCQTWESAANQAKPFGVRVVCLRIGLVLGRDGGMLAQLLTPFEFGLGGPMGAGQHWMSWIERDDLVRLMAHVMLTPELVGPVNATAPNPVTNKVFTKALGSALNRPAILRVPALPLKLVAGGLAEELLLGGQRVLPSKAQDSGFEFRYPQLGDALNMIVGKRTKSRHPVPDLKHGFFFD